MAKISRTVTAVEGLDLTAFTQDVEDRHPCGRSRKISKRLTRLYTPDVVGRQVGEVGPRRRSGRLPKADNDSLGGDIGTAARAALWRIVIVSLSFSGHGSGLS